MKMTITVHDDNGEPVKHELPARNEVCPRCQGTGVHDPKEFSSGFTREDFDEDPDFAEAYMKGHYDVQCEECKGRNVIPVVCEDSLTPAQRVIFDAWEKEQHEAARDRAADAYTRRMENGGRD